MRIIVSVAFAALAALLDGGCSGDGDPDLYSHCVVVDGDDRQYAAKDINAMAALETARSNCALGARDPTTCNIGSCRPVE